MDNRKFEQLIDLIINENEEQAKALFHDIVVEKSREIYESMMDEEAEDDLEEGMDHMGGQVGGLLDEIDMEEQGMNEEDDEGDEFADIDVDASDDGEMPEGDLEDRVVELEDKLDELMAEFEELMADEEGEDHDFGGDEEGSEEGNPFGGDDEGSDDEEAMMEATNLIAVKNPVHGDNGAFTRSTVSGGPKVPGNGAKAVNFTSGESTKGGTQGGLLNPATKDVKGAGSFKNAPGKNNFAEKGESVAKPKQGDNGENKTSIVGESKKTTRRTVR
jgi:hypothetical protein